MPSHQYTVTGIGRQSHRPVIFSIYVNMLLPPLIAFAYAYICEDPNFIRETVKELYRILPKWTEHERDTQNSISSYRIFRNNS